MKKVILIAGKISSGKNKFAEFLKKELENNGKSVSSDFFAKSVKDGCKEDFDSLSKLLNSYAKKWKTKLGKEASLLEINDDNWYENKTEITRILLQTYGTNIFRNRVDNGWWIKTLKERIQSSVSEYILITDTRFENEIEELTGDKNVETVVIKIERVEKKKSKLIADHESEQSLSNYKSWDYIIDNNGTLSQLAAAASTISSLIINENKKQKKTFIETLGEWKRFLENGI